jgi:hypothetical protein
LSEERNNLKQELVRKALEADFKNIVEKVRAGKTLTATERKTLEENKGQEKWDELGISRSAFFKYKKIGMPETLEDAKEWLQVRAGLAKQGSGKIEIGGKTFTAQDLIDLRGKLLEGQSENIMLKNRIERLHVEEKEGRLVDSDELCATLSKILYPLKKALDSMPENLASALNPTDPSRAEAILEQELENIYADLCKSMESDQRTKQFKYE